MGKDNALVQRGTTLCRDLETIPNSRRSLTEPLNDEVPGEDDRSDLDTFDPG